MEIKLEDQSRGVTTVAAVQEVSGISKTISDATPEDEIGLVVADQERNHRLEPGGENFGEALDCGVLKGNGAEVPRLPSVTFFGEENKVGSVNPFKISSVVMKTLKEINNVSRDGGPRCFKERGTKAIWTRTSSRTHGENSLFDLSTSEGAIKFTEGERPIRI